MTDIPNPKQALAMASEVEKKLIEAGAYYEKAMVHQGDGLRFIKFEASIKVKSQ